MGPAWQRHPPDLEVHLWCTRRGRSTTEGPAAMSRDVERGCGERMSRGVEDVLMRTLLDRNEVASSKNVQDQAAVVVVVVVVVVVGMCLAGGCWIRLAGASRKYIFSITRASSKLVDEMPFWDVATPCWSDRAPLRQPLFQDPDPPRRQPWRLCAFAKRPHGLKRIPPPRGRRQ